MPCLLAALATAGCASAAAACELSPDLAVEEGGFQFDDPTIEESFARAEQAPFPRRLAVYGLESNEFGVFEDPRVADFERALEGYSAREEKARLRGEAFEALRASLGERLARLWERRAAGTE